MTDKQLKKIILKEIKSILNEQVAVEVEYHSMADACAELRTTLTKAKSSKNAVEQQALLEKAMQSVIYIQQQVNQGWSEMKKKSEANKQAQATKQPTFTTQQPDTNMAPTTARSTTTRPQI